MQAASLEPMALEQDQRISEVVERERSRLRNFIRRRVPDPRDAEDLLPSPDAGPDALYARSVLLDELELALDELPEEQREVFVAHELEGRSFKEMAAETGVRVNTLLSRKRYAVLHLRERLKSIYDEFKKA